MDPTPTQKAVSQVILGAIGGLSMLGSAVPFGAKGFDWAGVFLYGVAVVCMYGTISLETKPKTPEEVWRLFLGLGLASGFWPAMGLSFYFGSILFVFPLGAGLLIGGISVMMPRMGNSTKKEDGR